jgi:hypothetical protein
MKSEEKLKMKVERKTIYRCDNCGHESVWDKSTWIALTVFLGKHGYDGWEYEFHLCSDKCVNVFKQKKKPELTKIANKLLHQNSLHRIGFNESV